MFERWGFDKNFNPRTHRGVRPSLTPPNCSNRIISIHAPIVGCDYIIFIQRKRFKYFNPRTHRGVRLKLVTLLPLMLNISIHAPIVGCDFQGAYSSFQSVYFNPRTHRGVRRTTGKESSH